MTQRTRRLRVLELTLISSYTRVQSPLAVDLFGITRTFIYVDDPKKQKWRE